ncbi:PREDICTED: lachrymatory-factor synthase-like [Nelumbo nucifera]|uniref:Lachrymatory-factor synthase-like n=2 Tax=Nelumbo nucifera TaxID=4432 RepID=A0A822ZM69_NELNU|nr:PREDICTED: lachrymatory-factor synthase-like [Nelumbo nucifera]DAD44621.1 TPA_asm: hypothetical protein HUJ06_002851 [Nelumbo nucifera]
MADQAQAQLKWEGKASANLTGPTADQVWPLLEDFFSIHKWLPACDICERVEGVSGQPGCIRYTAGNSISSGTATGEETVSWAKEKLVAIDSKERWFSYEVTENNIGFNSYVATIKVFPLKDDVEDEGEHGCEIEWSFVTDPIEGWALESLLSYIHSSLQVMAKRMEEALQPKDK